MFESGLLIHQPSRLRIMAALVALSSGDGVDFVGLRELSKLTDGNLSSHLSILEQAGYVSVDKSFDGKKPRTQVWATSKGREAFTEYVAELESILRGEIE